MKNTTDLTNEILKVCPIDGFNAEGVIWFRPEATREQRAAAQAIYNGWDFRERRVRTIAAITADLQALRTDKPADFQRLQNAALALTLQQNPRMARALNIAIDGDEVKP